jgi:tetratricopeptide (TPR) repeat protein
VIAVAFLLRVTAPINSGVLGEFLNDTSLYDDTLLSEAETALHFLIDEAGDSTPWRINQPLKPGIITIVMFSGKKVQGMPAYREFNRTIAWISKYQAIAVDVDYLKELATSLTTFGEDRSDNPYENNQQDSDRYKTFLIWVLGHELGHAHNHDSTRHFANNLLSAPITSSSISQASELKADSFAAERISRSRQYTDTVSNMLFGILNNELQARMPKTDQQGPLILLRSRDSINVLANGSHPEFIVRAARILAGLEYAPGSDSQFGLWSKDFLERIKSVPTNPCMVTVRTLPASAEMIVEQDGNPPLIYWTPTKLLLIPGRYRLKMTAREYKTRIEEIDFKDCGHAPIVDVSLEKMDIASPLSISPEEQFAQMRYDAFKRIDHAKYLQQKGQWKAAEWELNKATETDHAWSEPLFLQALLQAHYSRESDAIRLWEKANLLLRNQSVAYQVGNYRVAQILTEKKEIDESLHKHPNDIRMLRSLAGLWLELGQFDKAESIIRKLRASPGTCQDRINSARLLLGREGDIKRFLVIRRSECAQYIDSDDMLAIAALLERRRAFAVAESWYVSAYEEDVEVWGDLVQFLVRQKRYERALAIATAAIRRDPEDTDALNTIAQVHLDLGQPLKAERWFRKALKTSMNNMEALVGLAHAAEQLGHWNEAQEFGQKATAGHSWETEEAWACMADIERHFGNREAAVHDYENAVWLSPQNFWLHKKLETIYREQGDAERGRIYQTFKNSLSRKSN